MGAYVGAIDERLDIVYAAPDSQVLPECLEHPAERAVSDPLLKSTMTRLIRRIAARQVVPGRSGTEHPQDRLEDLSCWTRWPSRLSWSCLGLGDQRLDDRPLLISQVHENRRSQKAGQGDPEGKAIWFRGIR